MKLCVLNWWNFNVQFGLVMLHFGDFISICICSSCCSFFPLFFLQIFPPAPVIVCTSSCVAPEFNYPASLCVYIASVLFTLLYLSVNTPEFPPATLFAVGTCIRHTIREVQEMRHTIKEVQGSVTPSRRYMDTSHHQEGTRIRHTISEVQGYVTPSEEVQGYVTPSERYRDT